MKFKHNKSIGVSAQTRLWEERQVRRPGSPVGRDVSYTPSDRGLEAQARHGPPRLALRSKYVCVYIYQDHPRGVQ